MKDVKGYIKRLDYSMNRKEKLFFLNKIDVTKYDYIIDLGCANGHLLHEVDKYLTKRKHAEIGLIGVDNSTQIEIQYEYANMFVKYATLDEIGNLNGKVLLIMSSVLHELDTDFVMHTLIPFIKYNVDTVVIRDMALGFKRINKGLVCPMMAVGSNVLPAFKEAYAELLRYEYVDNYETERNEDYFVNDKVGLLFLGLPLCLPLSYAKTYILPYKRKQVRKDFGIKMQFNTHIKLIFNVKKVEKPLTDKTE